MTKQTINLLGGLVVAAIVLAGVLLGVLPQLRQAGQSHRDRDVVALQNQTQQTLISVYAEQRKQLPALQAEVAALKQQIAAGPHLEQLIDVAADLPGGAVLRSITPTEGTPGGGAAGGAAAGGAAGSASAGATPQAAGSAGFRALPVTVVVSLPKPAEAPAVLDELRAGPRLFAIDHVTLEGGGGGDSSLTVDGRVFMKAGGS